MKARSAGAAPFDLTVAESDDGAVVASNPAYTKRLLDGGSLADTDVFQRAVADAEDAQSVFFVNFDAVEGQVVRLVEGEEAPPEMVDNFTKIEAFGVSGSIYDGYTKSAVRLTVGD